VASEKAAKKKEIFAEFVRDTTRDNVSSTNRETLVVYVDDARFQTRDKCRYTGDPGERVIGSLRSPNSTASTAPDHQRPPQSKCRSRA
jgi:hypothetical protein